MKNSVTSIAALAALMIVFSCSRFGGLVKTNLFEGDNALKAANAIKDKVGGAVNVIRVEMHSDELDITIQSPKNPKDIDKWTYKNGAVTGPEPVQVMSIGNATMTGDKFDTTPIDDIGWANVPATIKKALDLSNLENAKINLISMDGQYPETADPSLKEDREKKISDMQKQNDEFGKNCVKQSNPGCLKEMMDRQKEIIDLKIGRSARKAFVLTWRLFVEGPRGRKDFWADKTGKLNEQPF